MKPKEFSIIPTAEELASFDRELQFCPANNDSPQTLSHEQVSQYDRDGYVMGVRIFDDAEADELRAYFDELLERTLAAGGDSYSISSAHLKHGRVYDLLRHPKIVACVQDLLGENVVGWGSHFFCKMPHDGKAVTWHQDASYWPLTPTKTVTVWLAIDKADTENACMRFLPTSHLHGHISYRTSDDTEDNVLDQTVDDIERFGDPVNVDLKAGEMSMHSDLLLHGSDANDSDRRRCGLTLRYCTPDVTAHLGWNDKGVVVAGTDERGHWANPPRPAQD
jgi:ectoine hydroxylase-related dioxygenase (phytanoyl-CoA dioxygenase family)